MIHRIHWPTGLVAAAINAGSAVAIEHAHFAPTRTLLGSILRDVFDQVAPACPFRNHGHIEVRLATAGRMAHAPQSTEE